MRSVLLVVITVSLLGAAAQARATMPPPPVRLDGAWATALPCPPPAPGWMLRTGC